MSNITSLKRKHSSLTIADKVELLKKLDSGTLVKNVCKEYGVGTSTVYDLKKQREKIFKAFSESDVPELMAHRKTLHNSKSIDVDRVLMEWIRQRRSENFPLDRAVIMAQAKSFHAELNISTPCDYSTGWYNKFKNRHGLRLVQISGEKASADFEAADSFIKEFEDIITQLKLSPEQVYNVDETALFWRYVPRKTYVTPKETSASGFKDSKERLTVMACANAAGTHKSKLLIIGKSKNPRALKGVKILPVLYRASKRAWMTAEIFKEWFENHFVPEARDHCQKQGLPENCKILLLLDNCAAHTGSGVVEKNNVVVRYLPPNCTSLIQPMDQGILRSLKCFYKKEFIKAMLIACNSGTGVLQFQKQFNVKDALWRAASAWQSIPQETLANGWHKLWPSLTSLDDMQSNGEFRGFSVSAEKTLIQDLLNYAKSMTYTGKESLDEEAIEDCFNVDNDVPITHSLTDQEICDMVLNPENNGDDDDDDTSDDDVDQPNATNIPIDKCISLTDELIMGLEQKSFITQEQIMQLYKIKDVLQKEKPKQMKQLKLSDMFKVSDK